MSDLTRIPNIGPATARALIAAGVGDSATLRRMGADGACRALIANGERSHFIGYYVLHMGLQGRPWNDCRGAEKEALRTRFDALVSEMRPRGGIKAALREICLPAPLNRTGGRDSLPPTPPAQEATP